MVVCIRVFEQRKHLCFSLPLKVDKWLRLKCWRRVWCWGCTCAAQSTALMSGCFPRSLLEGWDETSTGGWRGGAGAVAPRVVLWAELPASVLLLRVKNKSLLFCCFSFAPLTFTEEIPTEKSLLLVLQNLFPVGWVRFSERQLAARAGVLLSSAYPEWSRTSKTFR